MIRRYSELMCIPTFQERFDYLKLGGKVGFDTFGFDRYLNQAFYKSKEWRAIRDFVVMRDLGHDLCMPDNAYEIRGLIVVHHINPISVDDITSHSPDILDPEFLICTSEMTHKAIHYGSEDILTPFVLTERRPGDTCLWR